MTVCIPEDLPDSYLKEFVTFLYRAVVLGDPIPIHHRWREEARYSGRSAARPKKRRPR